MPVYARERKETTTKYVATAQALQTGIIQYLVKEKFVPKKYRYILVQDIIAKANELLDNVVAANSIFPNTEERLRSRLQYMEKAIVNCYQIENKFLCMIRVIPTVNAENLKGITSNLFDEIALIKNSIKNAHIIGQKRA